LPRITASEKRIAAVAALTSCQRARAKLSKTNVLQIAAFRGLTFPMSAPEIHRLAATNPAITPGGNASLLSSLLLLIGP
jgi:hypothetical protein